MTFAFIGGVLAGFALGLTVAAMLLFVWEYDDKQKELEARLEAWRKM